MLKDAHDLVVSTTRPATLAAYNAYAADWIGHGPGVRSIFKAADEDPGCAFVNAHAAAVHMALESAQGFKTARRYLTTARKMAVDAEPREQAFAKAIYDWWRGNSAAALKQLRSILKAYPNDIVTAKWAHYLAFNLGDAPALLDIAKVIMPVHRQTPEAWSMLAFARAETNDPGLAEDAAYHALVLKPTDPWAHHAIAHVMETRGRIDEGITFLSAHAQSWSDRSIFVREHNYWHMALLHLDRDEPARALQIFDDHLWGTWPEFAQEQIGAISSLWRLELRGVDVRDRWRPVVAKVVERWHEHILPFHDMHFAYALARGGRAHDVREFLASMARHGEKDATGIWDSLAIPCAQGLVAHAEGKFARAAELIGAILPRLHLIGGSQVQRDLFVQTWIDAALEAGHHSAAADLLARRAKARPGVKETQRLLQRIRSAA